MDKEKIKYNLKKIFEDVKEFDKKAFENFTKPSKLFFNKGTLIKIEDLSLDAYYEILNELMNDDFIKKNFSEKFIDKKLQNFIVKIFLKQNERFSDLDSELNCFREEIKKDIKEWIIVVPIVNLNLEKSIKIGDIKFFNFKEQRENIKKHYFRILDRTKSPEAVKRTLKEEYEKMFNFLDSLSCAKLIIKAEFYKSLEIGYSKVEQALDVFRIYVPINVFSQRSFTGVLGDIVSTNSLILFYNNSECSSEHQAKGFLFPLEVDNSFIKIMEDNGLSKINFILTKIKPNKFEMSLITALHWFGKAIKNIEDKDRFVYFFVALESIFIKDRTEPINKNLAERTAFLLESEPSRRIQLSKIIIDLYDLRSEIVHHGLIDVSPKDMKQLFLITQQVILNLINNPIFENRDEFFERLEEIKYGVVNCMYSSEAENIFGILFSN